VIQLNTHRAEVAHTLLLNKCNNFKSYICFVQEPQTYKNRLINKPRRTLTCATMLGNIRPRAAIFISNNLKFTELKEFSSADCAVAVGKIGGKMTVISSIYMDIENTNVIPEQVHALIHYATTNKYAILLAIDTNAHSSLYGPDTNSRGTKMEEFIVNNNLVIENKINKPTFQSTRAESYIDVTLSRDLATQVDAWIVNDDYNGSDHNTIEFNLNTEKEIIPEHRNWDKADWDLFKKELQATQLEYPQTISDKKLDKQVAKLYRVLNKALDKACPKIKATTRDKNNTWYTEEHQERQRKVQEAYKKYMANKSEVNREQYKNVQKIYKTKNLKSKKASWRKFKEDTKNPKEMSRLIKIAQHNLSPTISTFETENGYTKPGKETSELLFKKQFPDAKEPKDIEYRNKLTPITEVMEKYTEWIDTKKITRAFEGFESKKSPGPDEHKPILLKHLPSNVIEFINFLYKATIFTGYTPKLWKETKVIFIPKPGKDKYTTPNSFRPISLSNYLLKGLERLMVWRVDTTMKDKPIHTRQHGFRTDRSTETAISDTLDYIEKYVYNRQHCVGVFLDIEAAFNSISIDQICNQLIKHGTEEAIVKWYKDYITSRIISYQNGDDTITKNVSLGFPQGGVASAVFWAIAFNPAVNIINKYDIRGNAFADDCGALFGGSHLNRIIPKLQKMLNELTAWGKSCNLKFNPQKTVVVHFTRRRVKPNLEIKVDGVAVKYSDTVKYLGVTLDSKMTWQPHILNKIDKTKKLIYVISSLTREGFGPSPELMRWAYTAVVRPVLTYASVNWGHEIQNLTIRRKLQSLDRLAMLSFAKVHRSTPTQGLEIIYDITPLEIFIEYNAVKSYIRNRHLMNLEPQHGRQM